jgi:hypothetical protein
MSATTREELLGRCAYCAEPLLFSAMGIMAWRVGSRFVCNEFCADGVSSNPADPRTTGTDAAHAPQAPATAPLFQVQRGSLRAAR